MYGLGLYVPELKIIFQSNIRCGDIKCQSLGKQQLWQLLSFLFSSLFPKSSCQYCSLLYMHKIENKSLWGDEMSYGGETWYRYDNNI